jgi:putative GTP pyrophosphokinase
MSNIKKEYSDRFDCCLRGIAESIERDIKENLKKSQRIDRVAGRAKAISSFIKKARKIENGSKKYSDSINQIQDQIGVRIIVLYSDDVDKISKKIENYYKPVERHKYVPDSHDKFGYEGKHYIMMIPDHLLIEFSGCKYPKFFELQIKTIFQHAWSEAEHDLGYKPNNALEFEEKRKLAFTAAQAWGADHMFNELFLSSRKKK